MSVAVAAWPESSAPVLEVRDLRLSYTPGKEILKGVSFSVAAGDFLAIIGPSGSGKSTLIRCINRLVKPTSGTIHFAGCNLARLKEAEMRRQRRAIGMIFQEYNLIERLSVIDNVLTGRLGYTGTLRSVYRMFSKEDVRRAILLIDRVGLIDHLEKRADQLSGGQRQRVGIARALIQDPQLLLADEPTSSLDPKIARDVICLVKEIAGEFKIPVLCNMHDVNLALECATRVLGLQDGQSKFVAPPSLIDKRQLAALYAMEVL
jgi:phosphonate transport system ATP-binding protein